MKILWLIPLIIEKQLFMASEKNEIARSIRDLGHSIDSIIGYTSELPPMGGFSELETIVIKEPRFIYKTFFHLKMLRSIYKKKSDIIIFGIHSAHLIPFLWLRNIYSKRKVLSVLDIRTIPVDVSKKLKDRIAIFRFKLALAIAGLFCQTVTFITPMMRDMLLAKIPMTSQKNTCVFGTGVNMAHFDPENSKDIRKELNFDERFVVIYHGTLSPNRGIQSAIKAIAKLTMEIPEILFIIVGSGEAESLLKSLVQELEVEENVLFTGAIPYLKIPDYIKSADLALIPLPSIDWWCVSSPIKLKEYLSIGIPVLATDIEAHRRVLQDTGGGTLLRDSSVSSIAGGILDFYKTNKITYPLKSRKELKEIISYAAQSEILINHLEKYLALHNSK